MHLDTENAEWMTGLTSLVVYNSVRERITRKKKLNMINPLRRKKLDFLEDSVIFGKNVLF